MLERQRALLELVRRSNGIIHRLRLVKLSFLLGQEHTLPQTYQFVPYRFGPFSFLLCHELNRLAQDGLVRFPTDEEVVITDEGTGHAHVSDARWFRGIADCWHRYGSLSSSDLLQLVYARYPSYAVNSERRGRARHPLPAAPPAVYTLGLGGLEIDGFLGMVMAAGLSRIIDVRSNPVSRRYGFHGKTLGGLAGRLGLDYAHVPEAGIPGADRGLCGGDARARLLDEYERRMAEGGREIVERLTSLARSRPSVLICQESDEACCHRSRLAKIMSERSALPVVHLGGPRNGVLSSDSTADHCDDVPASFGQL